MAVDTRTGEIAILWWNSSMSPQGKDSFTTEKVEEFEKTLSDLIARLPDIIIVGEVGEGSIDAVYRVADRAKYEVANLYSKVGRFTYSNIALVRNDVSVVEILQPGTVLIDERNFKICTILRCVIRSFPVNIYVVHWSSRIYIGESDGRRSDFGSELRRLIDVDVATSNIDAIFVIGDFNDEPYSRGVYSKLRSARTREAVSKNRDLIFNPFWQNMVTSDDDVHVGTYYSDLKDRWITIDQIMVSAAALEAFGEVDVFRTGPVPDKRTISHVKNNAHGFDHIPVQIVMVQNAKQIH